MEALRASESKQAAMPSRGTPSSTGPWMNFTATFYNNGVESTGKHPGDRGYGVTASGRPTTDHVTISVDPRIIPLGSVVELQYPDGKTEYRRADDTGSAIHGHHIDVFANVSVSELYQMGKQQVQLRVIN